MRASYRVGEFFGIGVRVHVTFLLLLGWIGVSALLETGSLAAMAVNILVVVTLFAIVVMHEYGHALTARAFGVATRQITLYPIGGVAMLDRMPQSPRAQLLIALAGPAVNFLLAGLIAVVAVTGAFGGVAALGEHTSLLGFLFWTNIVLGGFNLLPALPMDGGRVLRAFLAMRMPALRATEIAARVAKVVAVGMALYALLNQQLILLLIAGFVWVMSSLEKRAAAIEARSVHPPRGPFFLRFDDR